jgi:hypothetical protein
MKKTEDLKISLPEEAIVIQDGSFRIRPVLSVNITNIEDISVAYDKNKTESFKKVKTYCFKGMADKKVMAEILQIEAQLWYEASVTSHLYKDPNNLNSTKLIQFILNKSIFTGDMVGFFG